MPDAGQIYRIDATDAQRERVLTIARDLEIDPEVLPPPDRATPPMSSRLPPGYRERLDAVSDQLRLMPGATRRMAVALGLDMLERAVEVVDP